MNRLLGKSADVLAFLVGNLCGGHKVAQGGRNGSHGRHKLAQGGRNSTRGGHKLHKVGHNPIYDLVFLNDEMENSAWKDCILPSGVIIY